MKTIVCLMVLVLSQAAWAGVELYGYGAELTVAKSLVFKSGSTPEFRHDASSNIRKHETTFSFRASHTKYFIDFIDNRMNDMMMKLLKDKQPQAWSIDADDKYSYTFTVMMPPKELIDELPKNQQTEFGKTPVVKIECGASFVYVPSFILITDWRPALSPENIAKYEQILAPAKKVLADSIAQSKAEEERLKRIKRAIEMEKEDSKKQPKPEPRKPFTAEDGEGTSL